MCHNLPPQQPFPWWDIFKLRSAHLFRVLLRRHPPWLSRFPLRAERDAQRREAGAPAGAGLGHLGLERYRRQERVFLRIARRRREGRQARVRGSEQARTAGGVTIGAGTALRGGRLRSGQLDDFDLRRTEGRAEEAAASIGGVRRVRTRLLQGDTVQHYATVNRLSAK